MASSSFLLAAAVAATTYCPSMVERVQLLPSIVGKTVVVGSGEYFG
jgi:hypothetical protein